MLALAWACAACATPEPGLDPFAPRQVSELGQWDLHAGGRLVGRAELMRIRDPNTPEAFYRVSNPRGQWLGFVDRQGRVYQRVPFAQAEIFRGVHPLPVALGLLCGESGPVVVRSANASAASSEVGLLPAMEAPEPAPIPPADRPIWAGPRR